MSVHPPGSVKLLQTPEVTWLGTVMLIDGVNEKETKEIIENKNEAERQSTAIFNADKERDKKKDAREKHRTEYSYRGVKRLKVLCFCFGTTYLEVSKCF